MIDKSLAVYACICPLLFLTLKWIQRKVSLIKPPHPGETPLSDVCGFAFHLSFFVTIAIIAAGMHCGAALVLYGISNSVYIDLVSMEIKLRESAERRKSSQKELTKPTSDSQSCSLSLRKTYPILGSFPPGWRGWYNYLCHATAFLTIVSVWGVIARPLTNFTKLSPVLREVWPLSDDTLNSDEAVMCFLICFSYFYRSFFMQTSDRSCIKQTFPHLAFPGRVVAAIGEIAFVKLNLTCNHQYFDMWDENGIWTIRLIYLAETLSTIGVIKRSPLWFCFENSIWAFIIATCSFCSGLYGDIVVSVLGFSLLYYLLFYDIPGYYYTWKNASPGRILGFFDGFKDSLTTLRIEDTDGYWIRHYHMCNLNYICAPIWALHLVGAF